VHWLYLDLRGKIPLSWLNILHKVGEVRLLLAPQILLLGEISLQLPVKLLGAHVVETVSFMLLRLQFGRFIVLLLRVTPRWLIRRAGLL